MPADPRAFPQTSVGILYRGGGSYDAAFFASETLPTYEVVAVFKETGSGARIAMPMTTGPPGNSRSSKCGSSRCPTASQPRLQRSTASPSGRMAARGYLTRHSCPGRAVQGLPAPKAPPQSTETKQTGAEQANRGRLWHRGRP